MTSPARGQSYQAAGPILDLDPANSVITSGHTIPLANGGVAVGVGTLVPGATQDVDWFRLQMDAGDTVLLITVPLGALPTSFLSPNTSLRVQDPGGTIIAAINDVGSDFPSTNPNARLGDGTRACSHHRDLRRAGHGAERRRAASPAPTC